MPSACQVVPEIPSFAVDDGFTYLIPDGMDVSVGSKVRIRVSGRRLAGYVTALVEPPPGRKLLPIDAVSGNVPLFNDTTLGVCRWAATHYVSPLSVLLKRTGPPNVARAARSYGGAGTPQTAKRAQAIEFVVGRSPHLPAISEAIEGRSSGSAVGVLVPTASEAATVAGRLAQVHGDRVVMATSSLSGKETTRAWVAAATKTDTILVGTREIALWPLHQDGSWILVEEGRRVMKSPSTPTIHAREILIERTNQTGGSLTVVGPLPTLEILEAGAEVKPASGRWWPNVEVIDRTLEPPTSSLFTEQVKRAVVAAVREDQRTFVLVTARGYAPAFRCVRCNALRQCRVCGASATNGEACRRCSTRFESCASCRGNRFEPLGAGIGRVVDDIGRFVGADNVGAANSDAKVLVGSERDLVDLGPVDLAVIVDLDGMVGAPHYRAREDALRLTVRAANRTHGGGGRRLMIQTSNVNDPTVDTLRRGVPDRFLKAEMSDRQRAGFPPIGELIAVEVDGDFDADEMIRSAIGEKATVRGPAAMNDRLRWLVSGPDLSDARLGLRTVVGALRNKGAKVRVDADPIDL